MLIVFIFIIGWLYLFVYLKPSNDREWEPNSAIIPKVTIQQDIITIKDIRDTQFDEKNNNQPITHYIEQSYDLKNLQKVWFIVEPFHNKPFTNFEGIAHTYFVFDFSDKSPIAVSVEARREKDEKYDSWWGLLNQYELMYTWDTEQNQTVRRVISEHNKLYMYPLVITPDQSKKLFLQLAQTTHQLESTPRFYNSLLSNCTNELAKNANAIAPGSIPQNIALYLPGYSAQELYKLKLIPNSKPVDEMIKNAEISDFVTTHFKDKDFSQALRQKVSAL